MARINAYGAEEIARWERQSEQYVLCSDGRLLARISGKTSWLVRAHNETLEQVQTIMERTGGKPIQKGRRVPSKRSDAIDFSTLIDISE